MPRSASGAVFESCTGMPRVSEPGVEQLDGCQAHSIGFPHAGSAEPARPKGSGAATLVMRRSRARVSADSRCGARSRRPRLLPSCWPRGNPLTDSTQYAATEKLLWSCRI